MTAFEAARMELEIKYCKKLERTLADLRQELENLKREAPEDGLAAQGAFVRGGEE